MLETIRDSFYFQADMGVLKKFADQQAGQHWTEYLDTTRIGKAARGTTKALRVFLDPHPVTFEWLYRRHIHGLPRSEHGYYNGQLMQYWDREMVHNLGWYYSVSGLQGSPEDLLINCYDKRGKLYLTLDDLPLELKMPRGKWLMLSYMLKIAIPGPIAYSAILENPNFTRKER